MLFFPPPSQHQKPAVIRIGHEFTSQTAAQFPLFFAALFILPRALVLLLVLSPSQSCHWLITLMCTPVLCFFVCLYPAVSLSHYDVLSCFMSVSLVLGQQTKMLCGGKTDHRTGIPANKESQIRLFRSFAVMTK